MDIMKIRGAYRIKQTIKQANTPGLVLMYHRVADIEQDPWQICVSPSNFAAHMKVLKKYTRPMQVRQLAKRVRHLTVGRKRVAVTFDDGYADNALNARPVLEVEGIPATFFIVSGALDNREEYWWDELERLILAPRTLPPVFQLSIGGKPYRWSIAASLERGPADLSSDQVAVPGDNTQLSRMDLYYVLWRLLSDLSFQEKRAALAHVAAWAGVAAGSRPTHRVMSSKELQSMAKSPLFEIGAHTVRHPMLSKLSEKDQEAEIKYSREDIEKIIGIPVTSFAYPHGMYTAQTVAILKRLKFAAACTVEQRLALRGEDPLRLPRFNVLNWSGAEFEHHLKKWLGNP